MMKHRKLKGMWEMQTLMSHLWPVNVSQHRLGEKLIHVSLCKTPSVPSYGSISSAQTGNKLSKSILRLLLMLLFTSAVISVSSPRVHTAGHQGRA